VTGPVEAAEKVSKMVPSERSGKKRRGFSATLVSETLLRVALRRTARRFCAVKHNKEGPSTTNSYSRRRCKEKGKGGENKVNSQKGKSRVFDRTGTVSFSRQPFSPRI